LLALRQIAHGNGNVIDHEPFPSCPTRLLLRISRKLNWRPDDTLREEIAIRGARLAVRMRLASAVPATPGRPQCVTNPP
jgi:hypothetical protein